MEFTEFLNKYQNKEVIPYTNNVGENPVVSVCVQTYNHEKYIAQCLDGILKQQVNFEYEIVLGEDASNDNTLEICKQYAKKYPNKIKLFLHHRENNITVHGKPTGRFNFLYNLFSAKGNYIAICEGDDYWTDPLKLQKQVDFLESNAGYSVSWTDYKVFDGTSFSTNDFGFETQYKTIDFDNLFSPYCTLTLTVLFKKSALNIADIMSFKYFKDNTIYAIVLKSGKGVFINEHTAVYRQHQGGIYSLQSSFFKNYSSYLNIKEIVEKIPEAKTDNIMKVLASLRKTTVFEVLKLKVSGASITKQQQEFVDAYLDDANFKTKLKYYKRLFKYKYLK